jgi:TolB-like protein
VFLVSARRTSGDAAAAPATPSGPARAQTGSGESRAAIREGEGFWVAVLPLKYSGSDADLKALAEGLSEEVITGLSRFSYLRVVAGGSTAKYSSESGDLRAIGKELGARYVMEGSLRQALPYVPGATRMLEAQRLNLRTLRSGKEPSRARGQAWCPSLDNIMIAISARRKTSRQSRSNRTNR